MMGQTRRILTISGSLNFVRLAELIANVILEDECKNAQFRHSQDATE